jgi:polar amino acid transport system substrate-binding protein
MTFLTRRASVTTVAALALLVGVSAVTMPRADATTKKTPHAAMASGTVSYDAAQATAGAKAYGANCASCHGEKLEGGVNTLAKNTKLTVGDMFTFMSQQMPLNAPASLSKAQYAAIMAYVLKFNGYPASAKTLTYAGATDSSVVMRSK